MFEILLADVKKRKKEPRKENGFLQNHIICNLESDELSYATRYQRQPWRKITIVIGGVFLSDQRNFELFYDQLK